MSWEMRHSAQAQAYSINALGRDQKMTTQSNQVIRRAVRMALLVGGVAATAATQPSVAIADEAAESGPGLQEVVVTGSRIASPSLDCDQSGDAVSSEDSRKRV
jgi:hypothetical protein